MRWLICVFAERTCNIVGNDVVQLKCYSNCQKQVVNLVYRCLLSEYINCYRLPSYERALRPHIILFLLIRISLNFDLLSRNFDIISRNVYVIYRNFDLLSRNCNIRSRNVDLRTRNVDLITRNCRVNNSKFRLYILKFRLSISKLRHKISTFWLIMSTFRLKNLRSS